MNLSGQRIVLTHATSFMGPALREVFEELGAQVECDDDPLTDPGAAQRLAARVGPVDVVLAHLAVPAPTTRATEVEEDEWRHAFAHMVDPLPRLVKAFAPAMIERRRGKILVVGSAAALRGVRRTSTYSAARGAQLAYVQSVGVELAPHHVQVNAIAQNFVENPTYFPPEVQALPAFQERLKREVPLGRLVGAREDAMFCAYLCTPAADCFVGQVFPVCGGWVAR
jgi:2-keto-3-deoxy-L-fuconate dehydrogenase